MVQGPRARRTRVLIPLRVLLLAIQVQLVALGNPHFSLAECARLGELCRSATARGEAKHAGVTFVVTTGRQTLAAAREAGYVAHLEMAFLTPSLTLTLTITLTLTLTLGTWRH